MVFQDIMLYLFTERSKLKKIYSQIVSSHFNLFGLIHTSLTNTFFHLEISLNMETLMLVDLIHFFLGLKLFIFIKESKKFVEFKGGQLSQFDMGLICGSRDLIL